MFHVASHKIQQNNGTYFSHLFDSQILHSQENNRKNITDIPEVCLWKAIIFLAGNQNYLKG